MVDNAATPNQQTFAPAANYWENPSNWAKPVSGNQFTHLDLLNFECFPDYFCADSKLHLVIIE